MDSPPSKSIKCGPVIACILVAFTMILYSLRPYSQPPSNPVEPRLRALQEPYTLVETSYFADGGSIGISITDARGHKEEFALPNRMGRNEDYRTVYSGALHVSRPGAVPVADSEATKQQLICVLGNYRHEIDIQSTLAILGGRWSDIARATANRLHIKIRNRMRH